MIDQRRRVWCITGTSRGLGHELVKAVLQRGDFVVATSRTPQKVFEDFADMEEHFLAVLLDLRDEDQITKTIKQVVDHYGHIDVLVNNAGYGLIGAVEEACDEEVAEIYETNVFGLLRVTRAVLPYLRKQGSGHIVNISSIGGLIGSQGWGIYNSTKFAIEGLSEALAEEVAPLGISVTIVEPGPFRTDFLGKALKTTALKFSEYEQTAGETRRLAIERHGKQEGDPALAAKAIIQAVLAEKPPLHLLLGARAYERANTKLNQLQHEFVAWREVTLGTDYQRQMP